MHPLSKFKDFILNIPFFKAWNIVKHFEGLVVSVTESKQLLLCEVNRRTVPVVCIWDDALANSSN